MKGQSLGLGATSPWLRCGHVTAPLSPARLSCAGPWARCLSRGHSFDPDGCLGRQALSLVCREEAGTGNVAFRARALGCQGLGWLPCWWPLRQPALSAAPRVPCLWGSVRKRSAQGSVPGGPLGRCWQLLPLGRGVAPAAPCAEELTVSHGPRQVLPRRLGVRLPVGSQSHRRTSQEQGLPVPPCALCIWLLLVVPEASCQAGVPQDPVLRPAIPVPALCRITVPPFSSCSPRRPRRLPWPVSVRLGPLTLLAQRSPRTSCGLGITSAEWIPLKSAFCWDRPGGGVMSSDRPGTHHWARQAG